jgi:GNAT superfamily N-acetyltransferase
MSVRVEPLSGEAVLSALPALAKLRIAVFREWPYLYEGSLAYEEGYLARFAEARNAVVVAATDEVTGEIVGAATGAPLKEHSEQFVPLFRAHGFDAERIFYCGESVLLPAYRGRGIGHAFFDHREAHASALRAAGGAYAHSAFCGVVRPSDDPRRPDGHVPLDTFWRKRGYEPVEGLLGSYRWREIGHDQETRKPMQFWLRAL